MKPPADEPQTNFIRQIVERDLAANKHGGKLVTRFPPEPNGYLHVGHAKAICLNFGLAREHSGLCNLRFDDTNPEKESTEYAEAIIEDVRWLGFEWDQLLYASDYFGQLHDCAVELIRAGKAYVCSLSADDIRRYRGTLTEPGADSPFRERGVEENLELFRRMRDGEFADGEHVLRAKINMAAPNINMRDPTIYRIRHTAHHRSGDRWCIYPTYDFTHCLSDSIEGITHSLCTLEFEDHRPLYDWFLEALGVHHPQQIEFARLQLTHTITSKRQLKKLVDAGVVDGWNDPRMPTLSGMRRRGIPPAAIHDFCERIGITKKDSWISMDALETCVRNELNESAPRAMAVLEPLKVVIDNYPEGGIEEVEAANDPNNPAAGTRKLPFSRELVIERGDFMEEPPKKFFRLAPGREVRLKYAYYITCEDVVKNGDGEITELRCRYDPASRGGGTADGRKVKGTLHWLSAAHAKQAEVRLYDRLFHVENPLACDDVMDALNPESLVVRRNCLVEPSLLDAPPGQCRQFERLGYFVRDSDGGERPVFNRTMTLRDTWAKLSKQGSKQK
ncbi:MAG: glutamine--tRNA ligase/YqeY domain fusion protein [Gammaproteobacteria bacterium]|nr:glutamine--tRNA ligase/YqeY domain fusion protein [Gammaproteobacteria bacterium]